MNSINARQRLGALGMALGITFSIVWSLSSYAYQQPPVAADPAQTVSKTASSKACS